MSFAANYFSVKGRIGRSAFWRRHLGPAVFVGGVAIAFQNGLGEINALPKIFGSIIPSSAWIGVIACLWLIAAWTLGTGLYKRLHDCGRHGRQQFYFLIPAALMVLFQSMSDVLFQALTDQGPLLAAGWFIAAATGIWILGLAGFRGGDYGANHFGRDPAQFDLGNLAGILNPGAELMKNDAGGIRLTPIDQTPLKPVQREIIARRKNDVSEHVPVKQIPAIVEAIEAEPIEVEPIEVEAEPIEVEAIKIEVAPPVPKSGQLAEKLLAHATGNAAHLRYLETAAAKGNRWAKLEAAATYLLLNEENGERTQRALELLREIADTPESYLGIGKLASDYLREIYRSGYRSIPADTDMAHKYRAMASASDGLNEAQL
ncbi:MAG: DUF805 domain-containing protein [Rhodospirillales bacterium]|nr:DUF805 domain-containing protein [Rhodospirillales bacterium]